MRRGRVAEAIEHSKEALRIRPGDGNAENNLGLALLQTGDTKGAVVHLEKALESKWQKQLETKVSAPISSEVSPRIA